MTLPRTIALDGPAGAGKSSVAFAVACALNYLFVDTGAFYRAVTLAALRAGAAEADDAALVEIARKARLDLSPERDADERQYTIFLDGEDVTWAIRSPEVEAHVSRIAAIEGVRDVLNAKYRSLAALPGRVIMTGRDIGTVVLPDADLKIYLDASLAVRTERRYRQSVANGQSADRLNTQSALAGRDQLDSARPVAPLRAAPDAHRINTDHLDIQAVIDKVMQLIQAWQPSGAHS